MSLHTTDSALRSMIDGAMEFLDSMAHDVDLAFGQTHGGATRVRDKSNPDRFGNGHSAEAKRISLECKRLRRVVRFVHKQQLGTKHRSFALRSRQMASSCPTCTKMSLR